MFDPAALKPMKLPPMAEVSHRRAVSGSTLLTLVICGGILYGFHILQMPKTDPLVELSPSEIGLVANLTDELPTPKQTVDQVLVSMPDVFIKAEAPSQVSFPTPVFVEPPAAVAFEPIESTEFELPETFDLGADVLLVEFNRIEEKPEEKIEKVAAKTAPKKAEQNNGARPAATTAEVKVAASRVYTPGPRYPADARRKGQEGTVYLRLSVGTHGKVDSISISKSSGVRSLDSAASRTVSKWKFKAATKNGSPVSSTVVVPIKFALR